MRQTSQLLDQRSASGDFSNISGGIRHVAFRIFEVIVGITVFMFRFQLNKGAAKKFCWGGGVNSLRTFVKRLLFFASHMASGMETLPETVLARIKCVALDKPSDARLRNQARVAEQDVRKRFIYDLPVSIPFHNRWRKRKRCRILQNQHFPKKGVGKFSKKYISGITKASAFEWYASFVLSSPTPSNEPCDGRPRRQQRGWPWPPPTMANP